MTYPYRSYMESLLAYDSPAKNSHMSMRMWYKDTAGHMDECKPDKNEGLKKRHELTKNSKVFELLGPIHSDFFNQDRFLLNNVELRIKLTRSRDAFVLMSTNRNEKVVIFGRNTFIGVQDKSISNLHLGQIPKRIIIGFVSNPAFNGSYQYNPFNFQHYDLNYLSLYVDSEQIPAQPITPDYEHKFSH
ncbi:uncharacterized protein F54H12.2-like [Thrips palmi]|uniref:Uncharacterized protein F54H12.2-like n=1 Tax=Thrips palmi TaxID=161013 RepID=A0A6P9AF54_THRPL|nr:uncharacterized protein F54H12.2-like [Thrips palmi]